MINVIIWTTVECRHVVG